MTLTLSKTGNAYTYNGRGRYTDPAIVLLQGSLVELKEKAWTTGDRGPRPGGGKRGCVTVFSKGSRRNLLKNAARIKADCRPLFITLTYGKNWPSVNTAKENHLRAFMERIRRKFPESSALWRIEYQKRGAPHFHILLFKVSFWDKAELQKAWADVIGYEYWASDGRYPFTRIERAYSKRGTMFYVSKYVAKMAAVPNGFNSVTYPHVGRWWGWFQKNKLPWADKTSIHTVHGQNDVYWTFKRYLRRYKGGKHIRQGSCTAFVQDAANWKRLWHDICINGHYR